MKRIINTRRLTPAEAARNRKIIRQVQKEFPPLPSPAQRVILRWLAVSNDATVREVVYHGGIFDGRQYPMCIRPASIIGRPPKIRAATFRSLRRMGWLRRHGRESSGNRGSRDRQTWYTTHHHWVISEKGKRVLKQADDQSAN